MNSINWLGLKTLYFKEVRRFLKVYNQTLVAPMVTALLFLAVFHLAMGDRVKEIGGVPFPVFMASGLIMMTIIQNAFANTSSTLIMGKVIGSIIDYLMPPISAIELTVALVAGGITRGIMSGIAVLIAVIFFIPIEVHDFGLLIFYAVFAASILALCGILAGIIADSFDQVHAITSYIVTPLAFLSGTFYSIKNLPEFWQNINSFNPLFYMIDGFRYSMTGHADANIVVGIAVILASNVLLFILVYRLIESGYRLKT